MAEPVCPYCRMPFEADGPVKIFCTACGTPHHEDCYRENGGCTVFGCARAPADDPKLQVSQSDLSAVNMPAQPYAAPAQPYAPPAQPYAAPSQSYISVRQPQYPPSMYSGPLGLSQPAPASSMNYGSGPLGLSQAAAPAPAAASPAAPTPATAPASATTPASTAAPSAAAGVQPPPPATSSSLPPPPPLTPPTGTYYYSQAAPQAPAYAPQAPAYVPPLAYGNQKSRTTYVVLGIFLGALGIHNFYAGHTGRGIAQLCLAVLTLGYLSWLSWIWAIVEICTVQQDGNGIPFN